MDPVRPEVSKSQMSCAACRLHGYITSLVVDFSGLSDNDLRSEPSPALEALLVEPGATSEWLTLAGQCHGPYGIDQCLLVPGSYKVHVVVSIFVLSSGLQWIAQPMLPPRMLWRFPIFLGMEHRLYIVYTKASMWRSHILSILVVETGSWLWPKDFMFSCQVSLSALTGRTDTKSDQVSLGACDACCMWKSTAVILPHAPESQVKPCSGHVNTALTISVMLLPMPLFCRAVWDFIGV